jgi:dipeptide/tripeptide permease
MKQFNQTYWAAIITELLHCLAIYAMMAYLVIYLAHDLGFGDVRADFLYGMWLFVGYFLPILVGAIADRYGFRQTMLVSLVVLVAGYMIASRVTRYPAMFAALMIIALGGAVMKPVIAGTVKAVTTESNRTLGFSLYYMMINVGAFLAPFVANTVRRLTGHASMIFIAAAIVETGAFLVVAFFFKNLPVDELAKSKSFATVINEMLVVLLNLRLLITMAGLGVVFALWDGFTVPGRIASLAGLPPHAQISGSAALLVSAAWIVLNVLADIPLRAREKRLGHGAVQILQPQRVGDWQLLLFILIFANVWALYSQIWTNIPLFITRLDPAMMKHIEYFQAVDPLMIVAFQVLIGKWMSKYRALPSMVGGLLISAIGVGTVGMFGYAIGAWAIGFSLAIWAVGEMMFSPRSVEYVSVIAPKDKLALYVGYGFLPYAVGLGLGPSIGAHIINFNDRLHHPDWVWYEFAAWAVLTALLLYGLEWLVRHRGDSSGPGEGEPAAAAADAP